MIPIPFDASPAVQQAFRATDAQLMLLLGSNNIDLKGRRIINAGEAIQPFDYVRKAELDSAITGKTQTPAPVVLQTQILVATHALRLLKPAGNYPIGTLLYETDRTALYQVQLVAGVLDWVYIGGQNHRVTIGNFPTDLETTDAGFLAYATDYGREYRWSGSAWADAPGAPERGQVVYFNSDLLPNTAFWQLCDGSSTTITTPTGGTTSYTVPDLVGSNAFIRSVSGTTGGTGGGASVDLEHVHSVNPPSTNSSSTALATSGGPSTTQEVQAGTGVTVASATHEHNIAGHIHSVDIAAFDSAAALSDTDILPPYLDLRPYLRR